MLELETTVRVKGGTHSQGSTISSFWEQPKNPHGLMAVRELFPCGKTKLHSFLRGWAVLENKGSLSLLCLCCFEAVLVPRGEITLSSVQAVCTLRVFFRISLVVKRAHA